MAMPPVCWVLFCLFFLRRMRKKMMPAIMAMPMRGPTTTPAIHALDPDELLLGSGEEVEVAG